MNVAGALTAIIRALGSGNILVMIPGLNAHDWPISKPWIKLLLMTSALNTATQGSSPVLTLSDCRFWINVMSTILTSNADI